MSVICHARVYIICRIGRDGMKVQVCTQNIILILAHTLKIRFSVQGTDGAQLWEATFATQAFIEVHHLSVCIIVKYVQRNLKSRVFAIQIGRSFTYIVVVMYCNDIC